MQAFVESVVKELVQHPDRSRVEQQETPEGVQLLVYVDPEDAGIVIGKKGFVIRAIRQLVSVLATHRGVKANVEVIPLGEERVSDEPNEN